MAQAAERSHGRYSEPVIRAYAEKGLWQIWLVIGAEGQICAVAGTKLITYDTGLKTIFMQFCIGTGRKQWQHLMEQIADWGQSQGCTMAEGCFRIGWRRIFARIFTGWHHTHEFLERVL